MKTSKRPKGKTSKRAAKEPGRWFATRQCPMCLMTSFADEGRYECRECGAIGFACCVDGDNSLYANCEVESTGGGAEARTEWDD